MAAIRYNLTGYQGHTLRRTLTVNMAIGQASDLSYSCRIWQRHFPDVPVGTGIVTVVPNTSDLELTIEAAIFDALDPTLTYAYQIDAEASDASRDTVAHGRLYVGTEYTEA